MNVLGYLISLFSVFAIGYSLECYRCREQHSNSDCTLERHRCAEYQDACTSYVRWGVPSRWTPRGDRIHYISKDCDTMEGCKRRQAGLQMHCRRDWYHDWACVECCRGDLCNHYVTRCDALTGSCNYVMRFYSTANEVKGKYFLILSCVAAVLYYF